MSMPRYVLFALPTQPKGSMQPVISADPISISDDLRPAIQKIVEKCILTLIWAGLLSHVANALRIILSRYDLLSSTFIKPTPVE